MQLAQPGPARYVHGPHVLDDLAQHLTPLGSRLLIITGRRSYAAAQARLHAALAKGTFQTIMVHYGGECCDEERDRILAEIEDAVDVVLGVGGGKVLDLVKLIAHALQRPFVTVPTLPSNCAAATPVVVVYHPDGRHKQARIFDAPALTLVDDTLLAQAPPSYFASGLADTYAKPLEARVGQERGLSALGRAGLTMADLAAELIRDHGAEALRQLAGGDLAQEATDLFDAVFLVAGMVGGVGGSASRSAAAHAIHNGLTLLEELHHTSHGEKVAYGLLVQSVLLGQPPEETRRLQDFFRSLDLPYSFASLSGRASLPDRERLLAVADKSLEPSSPMHRLPGNITADVILRAIEAVEELASD